MTDKKQMKAYVIKRDDGRYYKYIGDWEHIWIENLADADIFTNEEDAAIDLGSCKLNCKLIPITIQESDGKEVVEALKELKKEVYRLDVTFDEINKLTISANNYSNGFHKSKNRVISIIDQLIKEYGGTSNVN
ncbi:MAG: hypothetical protein ACI4PF_03775 [Christensenellales bacterium]